MSIIDANFARNSSIWLKNYLNTFAKKTKDFFLLNICLSNYWILPYVQCLFTLVYNSFLISLSVYDSFLSVLHFIRANRWKVVDIYIHFIFLAVCSLRRKENKSGKNMYKELTYTCFIRTSKANRREKERESERGREKNSRLRRFIWPDTDRKRREKEGTLYTVLY